MLVKPFVKPIIALVAGAVVGTGSVMVYNHIKGRKTRKEKEDEIDELIDEIDEDLDDSIDDLDHTTEVLNTSIGKIDQMIKDNEEIMADMQKEFDKFIELYNGQLSDDELQKELDQITDKIIDIASGLKYHKEVLDRFENFDSPKDDEEEDVEKAEAVKSELDDLPEEVEVEEEAEDTEKIKSEVANLPDEIGVEDVEKAEGVSDKKYLQSPYKERLESGYYESMAAAAKDMEITKGALKYGKSKHPEWKFASNKN